MKLMTDFPPLPLWQWGILWLQFEVETYPKSFLLDVGESHVFGKSCLICIHLFCKSFLDKSPNPSNPKPAIPNPRYPRHRPPPVPALMVRPLYPLQTRRSNAGSYSSKPQSRRWNHSIPIWWCEKNPEKKTGFKRVPTHNFPLRKMFEST